MIRQILQQVNDTFSITDDSLTFTSHHNPVGKDGCVTVICYENQEPICVGRISRWNDDQIQREYDILTSLRDAVDERFLEKTIESPLQFCEINGESVLFTEAIIGQTGRELIMSNNKTVNPVLINSIDWLIKFQLNTQKLATNNRNSKKEKLIELDVNKDEQYSSIFVNNAEFSLGPVHGDFTTPNIIFSEPGELSGVIDFEYCSMSGILIQDLMSLLLSVGINIYGLDSERVVDNLFLEGGDLTGIVRKCLLHYCEQMDLSREALMQVLPLHSDLEATRLQKRGQRGKTVDFHAELQSKLMTIDKGFIQ